MKALCLIASAAVLAAACTHAGKIASLRSAGTAALADLPPEIKTPPAITDDTRPYSDTLRVREANGNEVILMHAVKDENGEMVAEDRIKAAVVTARFRNVAEREGKVDIVFDITVPGEMTDSEWMLQITPTMANGKDTIALEALQITGSKYRKAQLAGYQRYNRFLESIAADSARFIDTRQLDIFIRRNLPQVYRFKTDSSLVSETEFLSAYGVSEQEAIDHYTREYIVEKNRRKIASKEKYRHKYIKMPIVKEGLRLDTIVSQGNRDITYRYVQSLSVKGEMKKVSVLLGGKIYQEDKILYTMPQDKPLDYYISSLSSLCDDTPRFLSTIIYRNATANTACYIDFDPGSSRIDLGREGNASEIGRIEANLRELLTNEKYEMDSILITASCSPEGSLALNKRLAAERARAVKGYFEKFTAAFRDSVLLSFKKEIIVGDAPREKPALKKISFSTESVAENWPMLDALVERDTLLRAADKAAYRESARQEDPDKRDRLLFGQPFYKDLRNRLYPRLRIVSFRFFMHRVGVIKDTVYSTIPDTTYAKGVRAIKDKDYPTAVSLLRPYKDYNSAVAYCAAGYNASAREILESLPKSDKVLYMLAVIHSRLGDTRDAVQNFIDACRLNPSMINRGNLDPEISVLIKEYDLQNILFNLNLNLY